MPSTDGSRIQPHKANERSQPKTRGYMDIRRREDNSLISELVPHSPQANPSHLVPNNNLYYYYFI